MKATALLTVLLGILLAGCTLRKPAKAVAQPPAPPKPVAVAAPTPAPPLSIPQTQVVLPPLQPVDPASLVTEAPPPEPEPPPAPTQSARPRRAAAPASQPSSPPAVAAPPEPPRDAVQEIVSDADSKRLREGAQSRRREAKRIVDQLGRRLTDAQRDVALTIGNFLALSEESEKHNDLRQAESLAEKALILAKELQSER
jgi:hypothetical protein